MTISHILMAFAGAALGTAVNGYLRAYPHRRAAVVLLVLAIAGAAVAGVAANYDHPHMPDPAVCVQAAWLDSAWRCIPVEEAG